MRVTRDRVTGEVGGDDGRCPVVRGAPRSMLYRWRTTVSSRVAGIAGPFRSSDDAHRDPRRSRRPHGGSRHRRRHAADPSVLDLRARSGRRLSRGARLYAHLEPEPRRPSSRRSHALEGGARRHRLRVRLGGHAGGLPGARAGRPRHRAQRRLLRHAAPAARDLRAVGTGSRRRGHDRSRRRAARAAADDADRLGGDAVESARPRRGHRRDSPSSRTPSARGAWWTTRGRRPCCSCRCAKAPTS